MRYQFLHECSFDLRVPFPHILTFPYFKIQQVLKIQMRFRSHLFASVRKELWISDFIFGRQDKPRACASLQKSVCAKFRNANLNVPILYVSKTVVKTITNICCGYEFGASWSNVSACVLGLLGLFHFITLKRQPKVTVRIIGYTNKRCCNNTNKPVHNSTPRNKLHESGYVHVHCCECRAWGQKLTTGNEANILHID
jgi:hypothetical protein